ncbi:tripartite tricarboxylate transporter substrate binding protein [Xylophilus sp. GW821-FHT01B05]
MAPQAAHPGEDMANVRLIAVALLGMVHIACGAAEANAPGYPEKPIHLIVGFPPGGGADTVTRLIGQKLATELGQPVIIENKPGAGGSIGSDYVGRAAADGYTLLVGPASHVIAPNFFKVSVDPVTGFVPVSQMVNALIVLAASGRRPEADFQTFRANVQKTPSLGAIASSGSGTVFHLSGARLGHDAGMPLQHVPYKGGGPAVVDLISGQVPIMIDTYFTFRPFVASGKVKLWATLGSTRSKLLPDVPTLAELGYPGVVAENWYGLFAPAGTPAPIIGTLAAGIKKALSDPETIEKLAAQGATPVGSSPAQFGEFVRSESKKWADVVKTNNIKVD